MEATRDFLRGKQTPGKWFVDARATAHIRTNDRSVASAATHYAIFLDVTEENDANAALIAEAGTVANRTGMWPEDMVERIKELEQELLDVLDWHRVEKERLGNKELASIRAILNKNK